MFSGIIIQSQTLNPIGERVAKVSRKPARPHKTSGKADRFREPRDGLPDTTLVLITGTDADGLTKANRLGELIYRELMSLPAVVSTPPLYPDRELLDHLEASRMTADFYRVIGGQQREGAIVVSQFDEAVDYSPMLSGRVANIVPVDDIDKVTAAVNSYTQTIGIYPESLKRRLRDTLPLFGAQRLTSLGYACNVAIASPQDAIEPIRRMCKWIVDEECDPQTVIPLWQLTPA